MDSHKIVIKLFVEDASRLEAHEFVPIFHSWIQQRAVADHLLIDVADYAHVHNGPGTCLITHEANFYTDRGEGRLGLMYGRKQPAPGTFIDRVRQALIATLEGAPVLNATDIGVIHEPRPGSHLVGTAGNDSLLGTDDNDPIGELAAAWREPKERGGPLVLIPLRPLTAKARKAVDSEAEAVATFWSARSPRSPR